MQWKTYEVRFEMEVEFYGAGSNGFANGDKVDSMLAFSLKV